MEQRVSSTTHLSALKRIERWHLTFYSIHTVREGVKVDQQSYTDLTDYIDSTRE